MLWQFPYLHTNIYKYKSLENHRTTVREPPRLANSTYLLSDSLWVRSSAWSHWPKIKGSTGPHCFLQVLNRICFLAFSRSWKPPCSRPFLPSSVPAMLHLSVSFLNSHISPWLLPPSGILRSPGITLGPPRESGINSLFLGQQISNLHTLVPRNLIYLQVWGIRTRTSLRDEGHYCPYHRPHAGPCH